jgi:hypothetical protein
MKAMLSAVQVALGRHGSNQQPQAKAGEFRVCYLDVTTKAKIVFIHIYQKNEKETLTEAEKKVLKKLVEILKGE